MNDVSQELIFLFEQIKADAHYVLLAIAGMWLLNLFNWLLGSRLNIFGIYPRRLISLPGIVISPLLHANFNHLLFNTIPLFVFTNMLLLYGLINFIDTTTTIVLITGFATWLVGRKAFHIGASGLIMGYWSYLIVNAFKEGTAVAIIMCIASIYYFGGLLSDLIPDSAKTSWEAHVFGFLSGLIALYFPIPWYNLFMWWF